MKNSKTTACRPKILIRKQRTSSSSWLWFELITGSPFDVEGEISRCWWVEVRRRASGGGGETWDGDNLAFTRLCETRPWPVDVSRPWFSWCCCCCWWRCEERWLEEALWLTVERLCPPLPPPLQLLLAEAERDLLRPPELPIVRKVVCTCPQLGFESQLRKIKWY